MSPESFIRKGATKDLHPHAVAFEVQWLVSEEERQKGIEEQFHQVELIATPDWVLPRKSEKKSELEWDKTHSPFVFWGIKRQTKAEEKVNCELTSRQASSLTMLQNKAKGDCAMVTPPSAFESFSYDVTIPFIKKTVKILADEELILKHAFTPKRGRATREPGGSSWVDHLNIRAAKKQKFQST